MNERQLKYILTIAREGNLTAAAEKLYISQPSLSSMLSNVEKQLGVTLFDRNVTPMMLTYAGEEYIKAAEKIINTYNDLTRKIDDINNSLTGRLNIGSGPHTSPILIPKILPVFINRFPGVQINLYEERRTVLEKNLISGTLDVAITTSGNPKNPNIEYINLYREDLMLITSSFSNIKLLLHMEEGRHLVNLKELKNEPFVLMKPGHQLRLLIDRIFLDSGFKPKLLLETSSWETCLLLAEAASACTILPDPKINSIANITNRDIKLYGIDPKYYREVFLCYRKGSYLSKILNAFIEITLSFCRNGC